MSEWRLGTVHENFACHRCGAQIEPFEAFEQVEVEPPLEWRRAKLQHADESVCMRVAALERSFDQS